MLRPRVIIADEDADYIIPLQLKFVREFFNRIDLEIITDREYFLELFSRPQQADILIISNELYNVSLQKHNIANIFVMLEQTDEGGTEELNVTKMFKYTSVKEVFNEIVGKSSIIRNIDSEEKKEPQVILVTSASGGVGKTTVAMGVAACLTKSYKRVLYINAAHLQSFQYMLDNDTAITSQDIYAKLLSPSDYIYSEIKHVIRQEIFSYLPAFKASLMSLGISYSIFEKLAISAQKSNEYDFIIIDAESTFDEFKSRLLDIADKVVIVTEQTTNSVHAANAMISNVCGINSDKYVFVCNKFKKNEYNALITPDMSSRLSVNEYVDYFATQEKMGCEELSGNIGIRKVAFLVL